MLAHIDYLLILQSKIHIRISYYLVLASSLFFNATILTIMDN